MTFNHQQYNTLYLLNAADGGSGDNLGYAVAISGNHAVVGAPFDDQAGEDAGSAYVFRRDDSATPADPTDDVWIHGCEPMQMLDVVRQGVAAKGMPAWLNQLGPTRVNAVIAYLLTIKDDDVPGKAPEGEPCTF